MAAAAGGRKVFSFILCFPFLGIRQLRRGSAGGRLYLMGGETSRAGPRPYWRFDPFVLSASFSNDLAAQTFMSLPFIRPPPGDWMGLSSLVSNLCHLDECVPVPLMLH